MRAAEKQVIMSSLGRRVKYRTTGGRNFPGKLTNTRKIKSGRVEVLLDGDPFPVEVKATQVYPEGETHNMATKTKQKTAKELRQKARALGVEGYEEMSKAELLEAVNTAEEADEPAPKKRKPAAKKAATKKKTATKSKASSSTKKPVAKKATKKKAASKKASTKKSAPKASDNGTADNPFRPNTNLYHITEALKKGGKRKTLTKQLQRKLSFQPRKQDPDEFNVEAEIDRRLKVVGYILKNQHGWDYEHEGRGPEAFIKVTPP